MTGMPSRHLPAHPIRGLRCCMPTSTTPPNDATWARRARSGRSGTARSSRDRTRSSSRPSSCPSRPSAPHGPRTHSTGSCSSGSCRPRRPARGCWHSPRIARVTRGYWGSASSSTSSWPHASAVAFGILAILFLVLPGGCPARVLLSPRPVGLCCARCSSAGCGASGCCTSGHSATTWLVRSSSAVRTTSPTSIAQVAANSGAVYRIVGAAVDDDPRRRCSPWASSGSPSSGDTRRRRLERPSSENADAVIVAGQPDEGSEFIRRLGWDLEGTAAELVLSSAASRMSRAPASTSVRSTGSADPRRDAGRSRAASTSSSARSTSCSSAVAIVVLACRSLLVHRVLVTLDSPGPVLFRQTTLSAATGATFQMLQVPLDGGRPPRTTSPASATRTRAPGVLFKLQERSARHAGRPDAPQVLPRRAPPALERARRRHEHRRPAPAAA